MAHQVRSRERGHLLGRFSRRGVALGALTAVMATATVPTMTGCHVAPQVIQAALVACPVLLEFLQKLPQDNLPDGYEPCGEDVWNVRGAGIKLCFYCSRDASRPVFVRLGCSGKYFPVFPAPEDGRPARRTNILETGIRLDKMECHDILFAIAQGKADEYRRRLQATIIMPNERLIPSVDGYRSIALTLDGAEFAPDGTDFVAAHAAIGIEGTIEEVAHYAARVGVRSLEFRDGNTAWAVEVCPNFPIAAIFKNGVLVETMPLFAPDA